MNEREAIEKLIQLQKIKIEEVGKCGYTMAIDTILKQLQAHKDKENKLREYIKDLEKDNLKDLSEFEPKYIFESIIFAIKQILNEGENNE